MRLSILASVAISAAAIAVTPALAQTRYGPPSALTTANMSFQPAPGQMLTWQGKVESAPAASAPQAARPEPLSNWARAQSGQPAAAPTPVTALPAPASMPAPMPRPQASAPVAPPQTRLAGAPPAPTPPVPAPAPARAPAPAPAPGPAAYPGYGVPQMPAAAPQPQSAPAQSYPGYGRPQLQSYPGYSQAPAPAAPAYTPPPARADGPQGARLYSVAREFGLRPDPIPAPTVPQTSGQPISLEDIPDTPSLAQDDDTIYVPIREQTGQAG